MPSGLQSVPKVTVLLQDKLFLEGQLLWPFLCLRCAFAAAPFGDLFFFSPPLHSQVRGNKEESDESRFYLTVNNSPSVLRSVLFDKNGPGGRRNSTAAFTAHYVITPRSPVPKQSPFAFCATVHTLKKKKPHTYTSIHNDS